MRLILSAGHSLRLRVDSVAPGQRQLLAARQLPAALDESEAWTELADRALELFRTRARCSCCPAFRLCEGYVCSFPGVAAADCDPWVELFGVIQRAAGELGRLRDNQLGREVGRRGRREEEE